MSDYISKSALQEDIDTYQMDIVSKATAIRCIDAQPTLDEKEIIRKAFEKVVERLEESKKELQNEYLGSAFYRMDELNRAIKIVKEEGGIE